MMEETGSNILKSEESYHDLGSSARKIGSPPIYIQAKGLQESSDFQGLETLKHIQNIQNNIGNALTKQTKKNKKYRRGKLMMVLQIMILICFIITSYPGQQIYRIIDIGVNSICLVKIIVYHLYLYLHNVKLQASKQQKQKQKQYYVESIEAYEIVQMWSIITSVPTLFIQLTTIVGILLYCLRLIRLMSIFYISFDEEEQDKDFARCTTTTIITMVIQHIKHIILMLILIILLSTFLYAYVNNINHYYCLSEQSMLQVYDGNAVPDQGQRCGLYRECEVGSCRNILQYMGNNKQYNTQYQYQQLNYYDKVVEVIQIGKSMSTAELYHKYQALTIDELLVFILFSIHFIFIIGLGVGVGTLIKYIEYQHKYTREQSKLTVFTFRKTKEQYTQQQQSAHKSKQKQESIKNMYVAQPSEISQQYRQLDKCRKATAILYNLFIIIHSALVIAHVTTNNNQATGIVLVTIFIAWSFVLALYLYDYGCSSNKPNLIQKAILTYETITYLITLLDYICRIVGGGYILQTTSPITSLSYTLIALKLILVLYNNALMPIISHYSQTIITLVIQTISQIKALLMLYMVIGSVRYYLLVYGDAHTIGQQQYMQSINSSIMMLLMMSMPYDNGMYVFDGIIVILGFIISYIILMNIVLAYFRTANLQPYQPYQQNQQHQNQQQQQGSTTCRRLRTVLSDIHKTDIYHWTKVIFLSASFLSAIGFSTQNGDFNQYIPILLVIDFVLLLDVIVHIISSGICTYLQSHKVLKIIYILSFIYIIISYGLNAFIYKPLDLFIRSTRILILFSMVGPLSQVGQEIQALLFNKNTRLVVFIIITVFLIITISPALCLVLQISDNQSSYLKAIEYGIMVMFMNTPIPYTHHITSSVALTVLLCTYTLIIIITKHILCCIIIKYHLKTGKPKDKFHLLQSYVHRHYRQPKAQYQIVQSNTTYTIIKIAKVISILVNLVMLFLLSYPSFTSIPTLYLATVNFSFFTFGIFLYICTQVWIKSRQHTNYGQLIVILLSLPGNFLLFFTNYNQSTGTIGMRILLKILLLMGGLHCLRLYKYLVNRNYNILYSKQIRQLVQVMNMKKIVMNILLYWFVCIMLWSYKINMGGQTNIQYASLISFFSGSFLITQHKSDIALFQTIVVEYVSGIVSLFFKMNILSIIIYPYIRHFLFKNKNCQLFQTYQSLQQHHDQITNIYVQNVCKYSTSKPIVHCNAFYTVFSKLYKLIFSQTQRPSYTKAQELFRTLSLPLYELKNDNKRKVVLFCDIIQKMYFQMHKIEINNKQDKPFNDEELRKTRETTRSLFYVPNRYLQKMVQLSKK